MLNIEPYCKVLTFVFNDNNSGFKKNDGLGQSGSLVR